MITVKNIQTGEFHKVSDTRVKDGRIITDNAVSQRFINKHGAVVTIIERTDDGRAVLAVNEGWELVKNAKKQKPTTDAAPAPQAPVEQPTDVHEDEQPTTAEPAPIIIENDISPVLY